MRSLHIYPVILDLVRRVAPLLDVIAQKDPDLARQALTSMPLNTAEGAYSRGRNRQVRFSSARASTSEVLAVLGTAEAMGYGVDHPRARPADDQAPQRSASEGAHGPMRHRTPTRPTRTTGGGCPE